MSVTGRDIAITTLDAIERGGGYIYGQSGAKWTAAKQSALEKKYSSDPERYSNYRLSAKNGKKWIGHPVWDCSGLTMDAAKKHGISYHHGSNSMWKYDSAHKGPLLPDTELPIGAYTYTGNESDKPHIGTYTGDEMVTEASGVNAGVVQTKLHGGKWKYWSLGKGVEYEFIPGQEPQPQPTPDPKPEPIPEPKKHKTLRRGDKGTEVREMQILLLQHGEGLPRYGADGDFGGETERAVKNFQLAHGLVIDGICGPKTWAALDKKG